jgi:outer membrane protein assembly factor BamB
LFFSFRVWWGIVNFNLAGFLLTILMQIRGFVMVFLTGKMKVLCLLVGLFVVCAGANGKVRQHRFLAKDESRAQLHYVNQFDPSQDWTIDLGAKGCRDIRLLKNDRVLVSFADGYAEYDLKTQEQKVRVGKREFHKTETVTRLANGNTVLGANLNGITFFEVNPSGKQVRKVNFPNFNTMRLMRLSPEGHFLFGANINHVIEANWDGEILVDFQIEGAKHIYWVKKLRADRFRVSTGYAVSIVEVDTRGEILKKMGGGKEYHFFSGPFELDNGNIVASNWTGHGLNDSEKGVQLVEFDKKGNVVWRWHDPKRAGTLHGVIVLKEDDSPAAKLRKAQLRDLDRIAEKQKSTGPL